MCALFHKHLSQHGVRSRDQQLLCIFAHPWSVEFHSENAETCCCSVTKWYLTLCNPKDYSIPGSLSFTISWNVLRFISLSRWCYLTTSSSATPCSFCFQSFPARGLDTVHWNVQSWPLRVLATPGQYAAKLLPSQSLSFQQNILFLWFSMKFFPYKQVAILMLKYNSDELLFLQQEFK